MTITVQKNTIRFNQLKNGKWSVSLKDTLCKKPYKKILDTWTELTMWVYEMADNNDIGSLLNQKMCEKMNTNIYGVGL